MKIRSTVVAVAAAISAAGVAAVIAVPASAAPAHGVRATAPVSQLNLTSGDIESADPANPNGTSFIQNQGGGIPYAAGSDVTDFSEVGCVIVNGTWCRLQDSNRQCMTWVGSGFWAGFVEPGNCVAGVSEQEWYRTAGPGVTWRYENRHTGTDMGVFLPPDPATPGYGDIWVSTYQWLWSLPAS